MTDQASAVAFDTAAPEGERFDAMAQLTRTYQGATSLIPAADIQAVIDHINEGLEDADMRKASQVIPYPGRNSPVPTSGRRSVQLDEMQAPVMGDYYEKDGAINFDSLRDLVLRTPLLSSIVSTRVRQVSRFCQPSEDGGLGFSIVHQDKRKTLEGDDLEAATQLTSFFKNCGWEANPRRRKRMKRDSFTQFMSKSVWDTLSMDSAPIETEMKRGRGMGMDGFYAVDGSTIRLCTEEGYEGDDEIYALQVLQGRVACAFNYEQMVYEVRNPRSDVRMAGYGLAEPELMVKVITGWLNALTYNTAGFDQNAIPKGMLHLSGNYGEGDIVAFKRYWNMMVKGINNAWSLPVMVSKDQESKASFEKFGIEFNEMMFAKFMTFLTSIACAIYSIAPEEINFDSFSSTSSTLGGSDPESKLIESKDKGLRPLLSYYEAQFTDFFVGEWSDHLCFRWVGLDAEDPKQKWDEDKVAMTWGELRKRRGDPPLQDEEFETLPLNPSFIAAWQAKQQAAQQAQMQQQQAGPDYGDEGQGGDFGSGNGGPEGEADPGSDATADATTEGAEIDTGGANPDTGGGQVAGGEGFAKALDGLIYRLES